MGIHGWTVVVVVGWAEECVGWRHHTGSGVAVRRLAWERHLSLSILLHLLELVLNDDGLIH